MYTINVSVFAIPQSINRLSSVRNKPLTFCSKNRTNRKHYEHFVQNNEQNIKEMSQLFLSVAICLLIS